MRFRGQRHGLVIQLLWSPIAPGTFRAGVPTGPDRRGRWGSSTCIHSFRAGVVFLRFKPQVAVHKGDMPPDAAESTLLLTNREKPIIINSFHRGRGARICGSGFLFFAGESPGRFSESKKIEA